ncbi:MAG: septum formation initiator family protein [Pseudomonadota bacterium]
MAFRALLIGLIAAFALLQYQLWLTPQGLREVFRLGAELDQLREENAALARRNAKLDAEVADLREGLGAIEERARTDLGMIRDDETFYRSPNRALRIGNASPTP